MTERAQLRAEGTGFLAGLDPAEGKELRSRGITRHYRAGAALFHERQAPETVVVLLSGLVKLTSTTDDGREIILGIRTPGDLLGEQSALDGGLRSASATALEATEALVVPTPDFISFLERHPRVALSVLRMLSARLRDADSKRVEFAAHDTVGRVAGRLVELAERFGDLSGDRVHIDLAITQDELAGWAGASRVAVSKALQTLRELGWIETGRRSITILDLQALRRRAP